MAVEVISRLAVEIGANIKAFTQKAAKVIKDSTKIKSAFGGVGKSVSRMGKAVAKSAGKFRKSLTSMKGVILALVSGVVLKKVKDFIFSVVDLGDQFAKTAKKIGIGVETLSGLQFAADLAGTSFQAVTGAFRRLSSAAFDAQQGLAESKRAFEALDVEVTDSEGNLRSLEDLFFDASDALAGMSNETERAALAQDLFGRAGLDLIPLLKQGSAAIRKQIKLAKELGITFSKEDAAAAEEFKDQLTILKAALFGFASRIVKDVVPAFVEFFKLLTVEFREVAGKGGGFTKALGGFIKGLLFTTIGAVELMKSVWNGLKIVWEVLKGAFLGLTLFILSTQKNMLTGLRVVVSSIQEPFDLVFGAVLDAFKLFAQLFISGFTKLGVTVLDVIAGQLNKIANIIGQLPTDRAKKLALAISGAGISATKAADNLDIMGKKALSAVDSFEKFKGPGKAAVTVLDSAIKSLGSTNDTLRDKLASVRIELQALSESEAIPFWERAKQKILELNAAIIENQVQLRAQGDAQEENANKQATFAELMKEVWLNVFTELSEAGIALWSSFKAAVGDAFASAIVDGENLRKLFKTIFKDILKSVISTLVQIGAQFAVNAALAAVSAKVQQAAQGSANVASVFGGQFAAMSQAPFPINLSAPAVATSMAGIAKAGISSFAALADGGIVTSPIMALIGEAGPEAVIPLDRMGGMGGQQTIIIELDGREIARVAAENMPSVLRVEAGLS